MERMQKWVGRCALTLAVLGPLGFASGAADAAVRIEGQVQIGGGAVAGSTVSLWAASADAPARLAQVQADADGRFAISVDATLSGASSLYLVASGGAPAVNKAGGDNKGLDLLAVLGKDPPPKVVVNELTTVASAFTNARFIKGESISGNPLGLKIAAGNVPNLVDPVDGRMGQGHSRSAQQHAEHDARESRHARLAHHRLRRRGERRIGARAFSRPRPHRTARRRRTTIEAMADIARESWADPKDALSRCSTKPTRSQRMARGARRRSRPTCCLRQTTSPLSLAFAGGGMYANGRFMFDADGNLWSGQNWMPGSQSGVVRASAAAFSR